MYTHARACSVLRKPEAQAAEGAKPDFAALADPEAQEVVRLIEQFPLILKSALERSEPSMITRFSADLAQAFNKFYYERRILDEDMGARAARLHAHPREQKRHPRGSLAHRPGRAGADVRRRKQRARRKRFSGRAAVLAYRFHASNRSSMSKSRASR